MKNLICLIILALHCSAAAQSPQQNYILSKTYRQPTEISIADPEPEDAGVQISYFDGLGRPIQTRAYQQSSRGRDIVTHVEYDSLGRQVREYLPFVWDKPPSLDYDDSAVQKQFDFYDSPAINNTGNPRFEATHNAYSEKLLEASPLNRIMAQSAPGDDWQMGTGHETRFDYQANAANDVRLFAALVLGPEFGISFSDQGYYDPGTLYKNIVKNENWKPADGLNNTVAEFKDMQGRIILKRTYNNSEAHDTYYVYDYFGNLTYVLPPLVNYQAAIVGQLDMLCYQYRYDHRNRLVEKKLPGKRWEYMVYDKLDRLVASGPAYSPFRDLVTSGLLQQGWTLTKYDVFSRAAYTGWIPEEEINTAARQGLQTAYDGLLVINEIPQPNNTIDQVQVDYSNAILPDPKFKLLTVNYYDRYDVPGGPQTIPEEILDQPVAANAKGMPTVQWVRAVEKATDNNWEKSYSFYDSKSRVLQQHKDTYLGGFYDMQTRYDFSGQALRHMTEERRSIADDTLRVREDFEYTPQGRLSTHFHRINNGPMELIAHNEYDELGQLLTKEVGGQDTSGITGLQKVDFTYNIRGWLKGINDTATLEDGAIDDLFAFKINYNTTDDISDSQQLYNGNISETNWRSASDNIRRKYSYVYDHLNRLEDAVYRKPDAETGSAAGSYNESMAYDKNGNITFLSRNGNLDALIAPLQIDDLLYRYKGNRLMRVHDRTNSLLGFKDEPSAQGISDPDDDYTYDSYGNMASDTNKGILKISYNHLNLPTQIVFATANTKINYIYNALGQKLRKEVYSSSSSLIHVTDYLDGFQYLDGTLQFFPTAEGYVSNTLLKDVNVFNYVYNYVDHLGNIRLSYGIDPKTETVKILEENHYYPFGLKHTNYNTDLKAYKEDLVEENVFLKAAEPGGGELGNLGLYKYKYNGKEFQDELGLNVYDYGTRNYDPALGRWMNIDPMAEKGRRWSPYAYAFDNPVYFIDPDGMWPWPTLSQIKTFASGVGTGIKNYGSNVGRSLKSDAVGLVNAYRNIGSNPLATAKYALSHSGPAIIGKATVGTAVSIVKNVVEGNYGAAGEAYGGHLATGAVAGLTPVSVKGANVAAETAVGESSAKSATSGLNLNKQLASESQMTSEGTVIAGGESGSPLRKAESLATEYGGEPGDWVKKSSESHTAPDGAKFETHWEENTQTGQRVNQKTKTETVTPKKETLN